MACRLVEQERSKVPPESPCPPHPSTQELFGRQAGGARVQQGLPQLRFVGTGRLRTHR